MTFVAHAWNVRQYSSGRLCLAALPRSRIHSQARRSPVGLDHSHAAGQLRQPLLQLLAVVVRGRLLDLGPNLLDAALDFLRLAGALDDRGVVLVEDHLLGLPEVLELDVLELDT